ncbi:rod shape-determining protein MreC [Salsuginibacillus kocurii]|uniref:rod shape-determining protein MreC n=1 Tax=Salsuginibacillus kocurii TaxID=427078 RepID=UPI000377FB69|nr:rod shape-determining protein MreC [Salsuginibacillus kocurii]
MPHFFSNKRLIVLMVGIIILVALVGFSMRERETITWPEQFVRDTVGVGQSILQRPAYFVSGIVDDVRDIRNVYEENQILKSRLEEYASVASERETLRQENETLQQMLDAEDSLSDYVMREALVIHRSPDQWNETIGINQGSEHGIERDMAVVTPQGLIGKVQHVSQFTSTVQLLSDDDRTNRVSAMVHTDDEPVYAFLEGWNNEHEALQLRKIESEAEIEEGQLVSTSGLGGIFPRSLAIGEVKDVEPDEYGLTMNALVEPVADFYNIEQVRVIERTTDSLEEDIEEELEDDLVEEIEEGVDEPVEDELPEGEGQ